MQQTRQRVTMKDIAREVGITQQSVSEVLNNNPKSRISQATRDKVMAAVRALNYRPNYLAASLKKGKTDTIGFLGERIEFDTSLIMTNNITTAGIEKALPDDKTMLIFSSNGPKGVEKSLNLAWRGVVDGLIIKIYPYHYEMLCSRIIPELESIGLPFVVIHSTETELPCAALGIDRYRAGFILGERLVSRGLTDIVVYTVPQSRVDLHRLPEGVTDGAAAAGLPGENVRTVLPSGYRQDDTTGMRVVRDLEALAELPQALVFPSTAHAEAAVGFFVERGMRVPDDIIVAAHGPVIGFNALIKNIFFVGVSLEEQGRAATELLLNILDGKTEPGPAASRLLEPRVLNTK